LVFHRHAHKFNAAYHIVLLEPLESQYRHVGISDAIR
jgi:hypothetical protein